MTDSNKFNIALTNGQKNYLRTLLPQCYSLQLQQEIQKSKNIAKIAPLKKIQASADEIKPQYDIPEHKRRKLKSLEPVLNVEKSNSLGKKEEIIKKWNIIKKLKKNELSWPFRNPVNIKTLDIPNYYEMIPIPMDLHTIEEKIKNDQYEHPSEIQRDINQIMLNSYKFNTKNQSYFQATVLFEKYYLQLLKQQESLDQGKKQLPERNKKKSDIGHIYHPKETDKSSELHSIQKQICSIIKIINEVPVQRKVKSTNNACNIRYSRHENAMNIKEKRQLAQQIRTIDNTYHLRHIFNIIKKHLISNHASSRKNISEPNSQQSLHSENQSDILTYSVDLEKVDIKGLRQIQNYLKLMKNNIYSDYNQQQKQESQFYSNFGEIEPASEDFRINN